MSNSDLELASGLISEYNEGAKKIPSVLSIVFTPHITPDALSLALISLDSFAELKKCFSKSTDNQKC
mgnify:CR=1 FL=1